MPSAIEIVRAINRSDQNWHLARTTDEAAECFRDRTVLAIYVAELEAELALLKEGASVRES